MKKIKLYYSYISMREKEPPIMVMMHQNHPEAMQRWLTIASKFSGISSHGGKMHLMFSNHGKFWEFAKEVRYGESIRAISINLSSKRLMAPAQGVFRSDELRALNGRRTHVLSWELMSTPRIVTSDFKEALVDLGIMKELPKKVFFQLSDDEVTKISLLGINHTIFEVPGIRRITLADLNPPIDGLDDWFNPIHQYWQGSAFTTQYLN